MCILLAVLVVESVIGAASAALKPIEKDIHPVDNKAVAVYKTTPQGDLTINLYFPPNWKASDRRPKIVFFFAGSCATGSPAQFAAAAEYFAGPGRQGRRWSSGGPAEERRPAETRGAAPSVPKTQYSEQA